ncbi:hypothetical protein EDI_276480 [Entamoeba dispar SAW760]|uniref:Uncharacterized protein n=1 Tax=Entamoeba dispar (strain ATCC PRA-260 / SAW760) TaxID=370354 RepID=B0EDS4_ENTDS|nr:uncharacterized protein EDI_276480 [Entamoeba dispar SAW760]EDR27337.1 hypothetical protein EDI_276480 [Entamoeba dispar SAW760]|eukprot:EDR27337.1 hypothetical protein EDI_276480 [Entamoeba dispar SAW760]
MNEERNDPIQVVKIEQPIDTITILSSSTCSCLLQNNILLFGKKGMMTAISLDKNKMTVLHQYSFSGTIEQMWYHQQMHLLICLINSKLESFQVDLNKKASNEVFKRITTKQIKNTGPFECFSTFVRKGVVFIAAVDTKKKSSITLIESKTDGIFYKETKVWNAEDKIVGCNFVNQNLVIVYSNKIQIITFFGKSETICNKSINPFKGKPRFLELQLNQILVHTGNCVYSIEEDTVNLVPSDYSVITISKMSPFIFFMLEFAHNKFYITYRLEPMTHTSPHSLDFRRPEYYKGSYMHEAVPVFISGTNKQLIYFTPNPKWYESAIQNGHYQSAIEFITLLGNNADDHSEQFKRCAYTLGVMNKIIEFYKNEENRTCENIITILNDFKMGGISPKNILVFLELFLFHDFITDLHTLFQDWFTVSIENWKKDMVKTFPGQLVKNLQDALEEVIKEKNTALKNSKSVPLQNRFNSEGHSTKEIIQAIVTYLMAVKSQIVNKEQIDGETSEEREIFYTSLVVIVYYLSPNSKEMLELLQNTKFLFKTVILKILEENTTINKKLLIEYYISQNHIDGVFNISGISYYDKRNAVIRILQKKENGDRNKIYKKIEELIEEKIENNGGRKFIEENNMKLQDELYLIFGKEKSVLDLDEICNIIEGWEFGIKEENEINEFRSRLSCLYCLKCYKEQGETEELGKEVIGKYIIHIGYASINNIILTEEYIKSFIEISNKYPSVVEKINYSIISPLYYKIRACIGLVQHQELMPMLLQICKELRGQEEILDNIYNDSFNQLVKFMLNLFNQKKITHSITNESLMTLLYSPSIQKVLKEEYIPLSRVNNLFAEISLIIFTSTNPIEVYHQIHQQIVEDHLPGTVIRFIWDLADPTTLPIKGGDEEIKEELKIFEGDEDRQSILEGIIGYLEKKKTKKPEGMLLTDCYLEYLKIATSDRLNATSKLNDQMQNTPLLQKHIEKDYDKLPWILRCRIQHTKCKYKGLLEYFKQMENQYSPTFAEDSFCELDNFIRRFDCTFNFDGTSGSIAKMVRLIRQNYRPFNKVHPNHIGAETIMYCVCQMNISTNTSALLSFLVHLLLEKDNKSFNNPFPISFALELYGRFYPIIPLKFTEGEFKWLGVKFDTFDLNINIETCLFNKMLDRVESFDDLQILLPAIYSYARKYFYLSIYSNAIKGLTINSNKRYEIIDRKTVCYKCHDQISATSAFVVNNGQYAHEDCNELNLENPIN